MDQEEPSAEPEVKVSHSTEPKNIEEDKKGYEREVIPTT